MGINSPLEKKLCEFTTQRMDSVASTTSVCVVMTVQAQNQISPYITLMLKEVYCKNKISKKKTSHSCEAVRKCCLL